MTVEVCPICDIAGCAHIRERTLTAQITALTEERDALRDVLEFYADDISVFRLVRAAGRKDIDKAKAVQAVARAALTRGEG